MPKRQLNRNISRGLLSRRIGERELIPRFLIICEGEETETNYFKNFRIPTRLLILEVYGLAKNTLGLVQEAIRQKQEREYDQVWCVFDLDSFPSNNFNEALKIAKREGIKVAYSNEAFELWYLLHFHFINTPIPRTDYRQKLSRLLGHEYQKNSETMYTELESRQLNAIKNAARLLEQYSPSRPADDNPSTTVHVLVVELRKFAR
jgi:hypothetical protein